MTDGRQSVLLGAVLPSILLLLVSQARRGNDAGYSSSGGAAVAESVITCRTGDSLLDTPVMRQLLRVLWEHSHADDWPAERRERGAILFDSAGVLLYRADLDNPRDTPCRSAVFVPLGDTPVAAVFTHPFKPGDLLPSNCNFGDPNAHRYSVDDLGGPSELDLVALLDWQLPGYILDEQNVYAVPLGTTRETAGFMVKRYSRADATLGCSIT